MTTITIDELSVRAREVLTEIAHGGEAIAVTLDGAVIAEITPRTPTSASDPQRVSEGRPRWTEEERRAYWADLRQLQDDLAPLWPEGVSAVDAVREQRREL